jgi:hypothetical protein
VKPVVHLAGRAGLVTCAHCERGFRRVAGTHIGSQKLGMIPDTPCQRVFATHLDNVTDLNLKPWIAYVDGLRLLSSIGKVRRFASAETAYQAACEAAPKRWHE